MPSLEARRLLDEVLSSSAAEHTEALLEERVDQLTRFANNEIHQSLATRGHTVTVRAIVGRRSGQATTHRLDASALRQVADRALSLARLSPEDPDLPEPVPPADDVPLEAFAPDTASSTPEDRAAVVGAVTDAARARGLNAAGAVSASSSVIAFANSRGRFAHHAETRSRFTCTVRSERSSGWVDRHRRAVSQLDAERLGAIAIEKALLSGDPEAIDPGSYTVVLEPSAVAELVAFLAFLGLGAQSLEEGRSFMAGRIGERITGESVTVLDDAYDPRAFGRPFDFDGEPRRRVTLIENGIARAVVHDRRTALRAGVTSTGHAAPPPASDGPIPQSLVLQGGAHSLADMIASTERGILVTRFWYNRVVDPRKTRVTGMTRDGTLWIENGRLTRGVRNLRFNESVLEVLARAECIGNEGEPTVFEEDGICVVAPALKVRDFHFTGVSPF